MSASARGDIEARERARTAGSCEWVNVIASTQQEIERVCDETGAPLELACHALDIDELARVDHHPEGAILVVMRVPLADEGAAPETPLRTVALCAILMGDRVVTIAPVKLDVVISAARVRPRRVGSSAGIVIALVLATADRYSTGNWARALCLAIPDQRPQGCGDALLLSRRAVGLSFRGTVTRPSAAQVERARQLLAYETAAGRAGESAAAAGRVYDKIHAHMAPLVGDAGVQLLFVRSAKLTQGEFAFLAEVSILEGGAKLRERLHAQDPAVDSESAAIFLGTFISLVTTFIGERLTTQLLRRAWPTIEEPVEETRNVKEQK